MALTKVVSDGIATGAVTSDQIAAGAVTTADLEDSGVTAGTYGSSSAIPAITVDAKGRVTSASTSSIDSTAITNGTSNVSVAASGDITATRAGTQRLAVTSTGIDVTGTVQCDGLTCEGSATITSGTGVLTIKDSDSTGNAALNYIVGINSDNSARWYLGQPDNTNQELYVQNQASAAIRFGTNGSARMYLDQNGHLWPNGTNTYDLGNASNRWRNIYTNDLNLSNEGSANDVDGTWGSWTIQEGEDDLFLLNRRNGKKYKFNLSEVN